MNCPVCTATIKPEFIEQYGKYAINCCPACGVYFSNPMKNPGAEWYENSEMYAVVKMISAQAGWHHNQFLNDINFYGKKLLDIGCGTGFFLNEAKKKGYDVWGLDFDKKDVQIVRERYGIENVYHKRLEDLSRDFSGMRFDVITLFEVLEHTDNPVRFISQLKDILIPGGYIAVSLPNRDRSLDFLGEGDYPPNHFTKWNKTSLSLFLERNDFEIIKCVIKRLDADEIACFLKSKIRFGISKRLARRGIDSKSESDVQKAADLMKKKDMIFKLLTFLLIPVLSILSFQGTGLYVVARLKK